MGGFFSWLIIGLIGGFGARYVLKQEYSLVLTIVLGVFGAILGGFVGTTLGLGSVDSFSLGSIALAIGGTIIVFLVFGAIRR
ncbi:MAG: GlsB/YeaQ/YmgE family stress response membrane protein [Alphaproteobacteria bacterium]|nr:MAG: GlsB/YeaQ/YmgE family stress response membrane protein [Alphaproteobacteria bacterium]